MLIKQIIKGVIMIGSISSAGSMPPPPPPGSEAAITDEQQTALSEILAEYDSENLTEADAQSIVESLSEAGIQPGQAMASAISELGFDAAEIGDLAGVGPGAGGEEGSMPPPPPPPQQYPFSRQRPISTSSRPGIALKSSRGASYSPLCRPR